MSSSLVHTLLCFGTSCRAVYRQLYVKLKAAGVGSGFRTFVYPAWVRDVVRARFSVMALYDDQYDDAADVYHVTEVDLSEASFDIGDDCPRCNQPMPLTP